MPATRNERTDLVLPLPGLIVDGCMVEHGLQLILVGPDARVYLHIEGWIRLTTAEGSTPEVSALDHQATQIARRIVGRTVKTAAVLVDGDLALVFEDGSKLGVDADREYQSWELLTAKGYHIVCGPGGKLTITQETLNPGAGT